MKNFAAAIALVMTATTAQAGSLETYTAIGLTGSERLMVHALSEDGLPFQARVARGKILSNMGYFGTPGQVTDSQSRFFPVLTYDANLNGGFANGSFQAGGYTFSIDEKSRAVGGVLVGIGYSGRMRMNLAEKTALDLRLGAVAAYAPEHDMSKIQVVGDACINRMISTRTHAHVCADLIHVRYELGKVTRTGARAGVSHSFGSGDRFHELTGELRLNRTFGTTDYNQAIGSLRLTTALSGPMALIVAFDVGGKAGDNLVMRERIEVGIAGLVNGRPASVSLSVQKNRGGMFLGEAREDTVTSIGVNYQVNDKLTLGGLVRRTNSSAEFYDHTEVGINVGWKF